MKDRKDTHVLVLCGGTSTEREVSLRSGRAVCNALKEAGYRAELLDIDHTNIGRIAELRPDVCYIALHGKGGEDGCIQGMLEWLEIPYTGPEVTASAICIDKLMTKEILSASGVSTPDYVNVDESTTPEELEERFGLPLVVKAACQGSSIGVEIVRSRERIAGAIEEAAGYGDRIMVEKFLSGRELTVPIIGNDELRVLPVIEITSEGEFYDYSSKYTPGMSHHIIPARISEETCRETVREALAAYRALGCIGISRVDVILGEDQKPYVIEVNTAPGMTGTSLVPDAAAYEGISFPELVSTIVELALEAHK